MGAQVYQSYHFRTTVVPLLLMAITPILNIVLHVICKDYHGSVMEVMEKGTWKDFMRAWPQVDEASVLMVLSFALFEALILVLVPGKWHSGVITPAGLLPQYKLNGPACYGLTWLALLLSFHFHFLPLGLVFDHLGGILLFLTVFAFLFYFKGAYFPSSADSGRSGNIVWDFYWGTELHPQIGRYNLKQLGMMGWHALVVCFAAKQYEAYGYISSSMLASVIVYIAKFFVWESGYFGSIDIMHDRFGYYICWGVLCWITGVYTLVSQYLVHHPNQLSNFEFLLIVGAGIFSIWANYDADDQRQRVRESKGQCKVWGRTPKTIKAVYKTKDGVQHNTLLLVSGWWGISRHAHYATELLLSLMWTVPTGLAVLPYFYVAYLFVLLVDRAYRDDLRCRAKYGEYWKRYCTDVQYCIVPYVY